MTIADKAADIVSAFEGDDEPGYEERIERIMRRRLRRRALSRLAEGDDEGWEPSGRLLKLALARRLRSRFDEDEDDMPTHRLLRLALGRRAISRMMEDDDEGWEPSGRLLRGAIRRRVLAGMAED